MHGCVSSHDGAHSCEAGSQPSNGPQSRSDIHASPSAALAGADAADRAATIETDTGEDFSL